MHWHKNKGTLRMAELFSNEFLQLSLEDLDWEYATSQGHAFEQVKISTLEDKSMFFAIMLRSLNKPLTLGDYVYSRMGADRLERQSPKIKLKTKLYSKFKLSSPIKIRIKPKTNPTGVVTKVE